MKKILSLLAAAAFLLVACNPSGTAPVDGVGVVDNPIAKVSIITYNPGGGGQPAPHFGQIYSDFSFDGSRIAGYTRDDYSEDLHYAEDFIDKEPGVSGQSRKYVRVGTSEVTLTYDAATNSASRKTQNWRYDYDYYFLQDPKKVDNETERDVIRFDAAWCATQIGESDLAWNFTYQDGRISNGATWSAGGDLTKITVTKPARFGGYKDTYEIEYSAESNPFVDGIIDPTLPGYSGPSGAIFPEEFLFGLMGRRCAHLPAKVTYLLSGDTRIVDAVSFTKDGQGRIEAIRFDRLGDNGQPSGRFTEVKIEWK